MSNNLKDILTRCAVTAQDGCALTVSEAATVLDLAEIGRLAVEERVQHKNMNWEGQLKSRNARTSAADAFLAKHGGGG